MNFDLAAIEKIVQDALGASPLASAALADTITKAAAQLPPGTTQDELNAFVANQVQAAFSLDNVHAAYTKVMSAVQSFIAAGGSGPVEKSPTDLVG